MKIKIKTKIQVYNKKVKNQIREAMKPNKKIQQHRKSLLAVAHASISFAHPKKYTRKLDPK